MCIMKNKINIAELLKNCPKGMELDCTTWENVSLEEVINDVITIRRNSKPPYDDVVTLNKYGRVTSHEDEKCRIFPKGKTTWEGFVPPVEFKDGDILTTILGSIFILKEPNENNYYYSCYIAFDFTSKIVENCTKFCDKKDCRNATEEEKQIFFQVIKNNGYKWNKETKTLEKLSKFKDGDVVVDDSGAIFIYKQIHPLYNKPYADFYCGLTSEFRSFVIKAGELQRCGEISSLRYATNEEKQLLFDTIKKHGYNWNLDTKTLKKLIKPIFKKGDKVRVKKGFPEPRIARVIEDVCDTFYTLVSVGKIDFTDQDNWELVPNKFDISKLKPFDQVLVRDFDSEVWEIDFFSRLLDGKHFKCHGASYVQCIPYKGNEHLHNSTDACNEFYETWKK